MNIKEILNYGIQLLKENNINDYNIKAKVLLQYTINQNKEYIIVNYDKEIEISDEIKYKSYIEELIKGKPLQYITNHQEFMNIDFYVNENVLIPQPDTEILVMEVIKELENIKGNKDEIRILDLCTGSGAIAISIDKYLQKEQSKDIEYEIYGIDISKEALEVAKQNAKLNNSDVQFVLSDMFKNIQELKEEKFDIIVSNPPYIEKETIKNLSKDVQAEPHLALDGGIDGLDFYRIIADNAKVFLKEKGKIFLEIGYNQKQTVTDIFIKNNKYKQVEWIKDFSGNDRVIRVEL